MEKSKKTNFKFDFATGKYIDTTKSILPNSDKKRAIIYVRVSSDIQMREGHGIETQEEILRLRAEREGIEIDNVFRDEAISGRELNRKGLNDAIAYLKEKNKYGIVKIHYFMCTELSRLSRSDDLVKTYQTENAIMSTGVRIKVHSNPTMFQDDNHDSLDKDFNYIYAKHERQKIKTRTINGLKGRASQGYRTRSEPCGYKRVKLDVQKGSNLEFKEPQASILKQAFEMFANDILLTYTDVLYYLNEHKLESNYHTPNPGKLKITFVERLFEPEKVYFYSGHIIYPKYELYEPIPAKHQALISMSTLEKILQKIGRRNPRKGGPRKDMSNIFPLRGMLYCPHCNKPMTARKSKGKMGKYYTYYGCQNIECFDKEVISTNKIHEDMKNEFVKYTINENMIDLAKDIMQEVCDTNRDLSSITKDSKEEKIKMLERQMSDIENNIGSLSLPALIQKQEGKRLLLETEKKEIQSELASMTNVQDKHKTLVNMYLAILKDPVKIWESQDAKIIQLLTGVLKGDKIVYKKNQGFQTPDLYRGELLFHSVSKADFSNGAVDGDGTRGQRYHKPLLYHGATTAMGY